MPLDDEAARRFDQQDKVLREILDGMAEHREYHKLTDPGVSEMVDILKGGQGGQSRYCLVRRNGGCGCWRMGVDSRSRQGH